MALKRAKERAEAEVKSLRSRQAPSSADDSVLRKEVQRLEEENLKLQQHAKSFESQLLEAQKENERMRYASAQCLCLLALQQGRPLDRLRHPACSKQFTMT